MFTDYPPYPFTKVHKNEQIRNSDYVYSSLLRKLTKRLYERSHISDTFTNVQQIKFSNAGPVCYIQCAT